MLIVNIYQATDVLRSLTDYVIPVGIPDNYASVAAKPDTSQLPVVTQRRVHSKHAGCFKLTASSPTPCRLAVARALSAV